MWRLIIGLLAATVPAGSFAQIPGKAFRDVFTIDSRKDGNKFKAYVTVVDGRVGLMPAETTGTGPLDWIAQPTDREPFQIHQIWIDLDAKKTVMKKIDQEAIVYDLSGKDPNVYYRKPDQRWGALWKKEVHDHSKEEGPNDYLLFCRAAEGELKGSYLDFDEKPIQVLGFLGRKTPFHPARLSKEPTSWGRIIFSGGHHSGVSP